jgi:competence protein ComEA
MAHRSIHQPAPVDDPDPRIRPSPPDRPPSQLRLRLTETLVGRFPSWQPVRPGAALLAVAGVLLAVGAGWWLLRPAPAPVESSLPFASADAGSRAAAGSTGSASPATGGAAAPAATSTTAPPLVVQAAGEVAEPGVYRLAPSARVDDLVREAGGLTRRADRDRVNLAAPLADGQRIWIPAQGQEDVPEVVTGGGAGGGAGGTSAPSGSGPGASTGTTAPAEPVDLNTATGQQLEALPGIGPATASAILAYRDQAGGFKTVDDLLEVRGIGDAKMEQLRPLVRV